MKIKNGEFLKGDCLELMADIPDGSVDMILTDLPYATTQNAWDSVIPYEPMWAEFWRVLKPNGAVVLTAAQPFTSSLIASQYEYFKYCWIWEKTRVTGVLNAKHQPLRNYEDVCVFYRSPCTYNPQGLTACFKQTGTGANSDNASSNNYGQVSQTSNGKYIQTETGYPRQVIKFASEGKTVHPTQKPVELFEYMINTYTNKGETVLDCTAGSGTTAIAAENTGRQWICIERDDKFYEIATDRVKNHSITVVEESLFE